MYIYGLAMMLSAVVTAALDGRYCDVWDLMSEADVALELLY
jgi:hypothetical protein